MKKSNFIILALALFAFNIVSAFPYINEEIPGPQLSFAEIIIVNPNNEIRNEIINLIDNHEFEHIVDIKARLEFKLKSNGNLELLYVNLDHYDSKNIKAYLIKKLQNKHLTIKTNDNNVIYHLPLTFKKRP